MRHQKKHGMKLGTDASHTKAMKKSLIKALLANDRIKTTLTRAKAMRPEVDKVITWAKRGDLHARRLAIAAVGDAELVRETFEKAAQGMWQDRTGGYTRIMKLGPRKGDNAEIALIELVQEALPGAKKAVKPAAKKSAAQPNTPTVKVSKVAEKPAAEAENTAAEADEISEEKAADKPSGKPAKKDEAPAEAKPASEGKPQTEAKPADAPKPAAEAEKPAAEDDEKSEDKADEKPAEKDGETR